MNKKKAIITLVLTFVAILGLGFIVVFGIDSKKSGSAAKIKQGLDLAGGVSITYEVEGEKNPSQTDINDTIFKLQQRIESVTGTTEASVYQEGSNRIDVEIPGVYNAEEILAELGRPGSLYFISYKDPTGKINYSLDNETGEYVLAEGVTIEDLVANGSVVVTGTEVASAKASTTTGDLGKVDYVVLLTLNNSGAEGFANATRTAAANGWTIAIYYDGRIISAPRVNEAITDGSARITGMGSMETAKKLASNIRIGGLKLTLNELTSKVVGAQLGENAVKTSVIAGIIGLCLVILFMIVIYRIPGLASGIALVLYTILMLLTINFFGVTLTLPGIAGIILSIGMAVDANVIIFARIREELGLGKTVRSSIDIGFKKALSAILDGNITTLIAAAVLIWLGTGPIKGFAITLGIGILLSMFSALVVTRLVLKALFTIGAKNENLYGITKERKSINFLSKKAICFAVSGVCIAAGLIAMVVFHGTKGNSLNYSLEFSGGSSFTLNFEEEYDLDRANKEIVPVFEDAIGAGDLQVQTVMGENQVIVKTRILDQSSRALLKEALNASLGLTAEDIQEENISGTISGEMRKNAIISVLIATICMLIYIFIRFKDIRFASSAVIALLHDVLVVLGFYAIFRISVGNTFIACMLTLVGYSINATNVIFDRIRENMKAMRKNEDLAEVVNKSITQTLSRSIYTSLTTFVMVLMLFIFGVASIRLFALPLMVGIVCGAYSSVCITGALWYLLKKIGGKKNK